MNLFILDSNPIKCAEMHTDRHVVKMIIETAQMLSTAHRVLDADTLSTTMNEKLYKIAYVNHPVSKWVRATSQNYVWTYFMYGSLLKEYTFRYKKYHKSGDLAEYLVKIPKNILLTDNKTPFVLAMPEQYHNSDPVIAYRSYYIGEKQKMFAWTNRKKPDWIEEMTK